MQAFLRNILPHHSPFTPNYIFYWFLLDTNKINCSSAKNACKFVIKTWRNSNTEIFLVFIKRIDIFDRLHFLDFHSQQVQWEGLFNLNWRPWLLVLNMVFFTITWKVTYIGKSILRNVAVYYQNKKPSQTFCRDYFIP